MNSLRFRLILGFSLAGVVPLALAMVLLSQHIQRTVRDQAADRLGATLESLKRQLRADGDRTLEKLRILGKDVDLKRLYLVQAPGGQDLPEYLAEKRFLLGLDFLVVTDTAGRLVADAASAPSELAKADRRAWSLETAGASEAGDPMMRRLEGAPALIMTASAPIPYQNGIVGRVQGGVVLDSARLESLKQTSGVDLVLCDRGGQVVASTGEGEIERLVPQAGNRAELEARSYLTRRILLPIGPEPHASIIGVASTAAARQTIAALRATSAALGLAGVALAITLGILWSLQVSRPVERLARFSQQIAQGDWDEPLALHSVRELETLVLALDRMRTDLRSYRDRLVASERHAAWSLMARKVAHEVRNPLTPIAVSIADLRRSYDQKREDFPQILDQAVRTVGEEVETLKRLLHEFAELGRFPEPHFEPCRVRELFADLETLYGREVAEGRLGFSVADPALTFRADRAQLRQALVNLIKNGLEAVNGGGRVEVAARARDAGVEIAVGDTGPGLSAEQRAQLFLPNFTSKAHGAGLGLTIVERIVNDHGGAISVESTEGRGTTFRIRLPLER